MSEEEIPSGLCSGQTRIFIAEARPAGAIGCGSRPHPGPEEVRVIGIAVAARYTGRSVRLMDDRDCCWCRVSSAGSAGSSGDYCYFRECLCSRRRERGQGDSYREAYSPSWSGCPCRPSIQRVNQIEGPRRRRGVRTRGINLHLLAPEVVRVCERRVGVRSPQSPAPADCSDKRRACHPAHQHRHPARYRDRADC